MSELVPLNFRKSGEKLNVSYDYFDLSARTGYKRFYGVVTNEGNFLSTQAVDSNKVKTTFTNTGTTTYNFDLVFKAPNTVEGTAVVVITLETVGNGAGNGTGIHADVTIKKVDLAAAVSTIGAAVASDTVASGASGTIARRVSLMFSISKTHFAIGETLRLEVIADRTVVGTGLDYMYHDAMNADSTYNEQYSAAKADTALMFDVPFKVSL